MSEKLIKSAEDYLSSNLSVIAVNDTKRPYYKWEPFQYRPLDPSECSRVFENAWGIAIIGGKVSDGLEFIDFDAHDKDIQRIYDAFMADERCKFIFDRHEMYVERSMRGGYHIVYRYECDGTRDGNQILAKWASNESMIETRGEGGYCVTYPTKGYDPVIGDLESLPNLSLDERNYLLDLARSFSEAKATVTTEDDDLKAKAVFDNTDPVSWFNWNKDNYAKKILEEAGWIKLRYDEKEEIEYWQRPGKDTDKDGWSATWGKKHNALFVFTQSVEYFKARAYYSPFQILVRLRFNNNYTDAIRWIIQKYGKHQQFDNERQPDPGHAEKVMFPIEVFPPQLKEFIDQMHSTLNFSPDFVSVAVMFAIATLNGNKYKLQVNQTWIAPTLFWFAVVGEPGTMKSHPISAIIRPIKKIDIAAKKIHSAQLDEYETKMLEKGQKKGLKKPLFNQIMISDVTLEAVHNVHSVNKRGIGYHKDELIGFVSSMNQYKGTKGADEQFWLESFNNQSYMVNRVSKETLSIEDTMINIIGTIQPTILSKISKDNGLTDRFLYTAAEKNIYPMSRVDIDARWIEWWGTIIQKANNMFKYVDNADTVIIQMDQQAEDYMEQLDQWLVDMQNSDEHNEALKTYLSKAKTYIPRFAMLMSIIDAVCTGSPITVSGSHMDRAGHIMAYFIESSREVFSDAARTDEIKGIVSTKRGLTRPELIVELFNKGLTKAEIAKQVGVSKANVGQTIARLQEKKKQQAK